MSEFRPSGFNILPDMIRHVIIINAILFLATSLLAPAMGIHLEDYLGLHYFGSAHFMPHQFITHLFMHGGLTHIFFNMFALWMFGSVLENVWGPKRFLVYYFLTGLGAAALHSVTIWMNMSEMDAAIAAFSASPSAENLQLFIRAHVPDGLSIFHTLNSNLIELADSPGNIRVIGNSIELMESYRSAIGDIPTVGASGAVFGVLLAFGMMFPNTYIYLYLLFPIKAKYFVLLYGLLEFWLGVQNNPGDNVAHFAHLGGMAFGYFIIRYWNRNRSQFF